MADFVVADTTVVSRLTKPNIADRGYSRLLAPKRLAVSFQTEAELLTADFSEARERRLRLILSNTLVVAHQHATTLAYVRVSRIRRQLKSNQQIGGDAADGDVWITTALEHDVLLLSHDRQQVELARAANVRVFTTLPTLRGANPVVL